MKKIKAFTLVELLVVVAIIALLLAILVPSLNKARELAYRIVCGANIKNIAIASNTYASSQDGYYVPAGHVGYDQPAKVWGNYDYDYGDRFWIQNKAFRSYINIDSYHVSSNDWFLPKDFLCPSDRISKQRTETMGRQSYAYNNSDWRPWTQPYKIVGYKASTVRKPAETINFIDSITFDVDFNGAHYVGGWDRIKELLPSTSSWPAPCDPTIGTAFYRHNEGANIGFYDGHAQWMHKTEAFDWEGYHINPKDEARTGMWTASGYMIPGWYRRFEAFGP